MMLISDDYSIIDSADTDFILFVSVWVIAGVEGEGVAEVERVSLSKGDRRMSSRSLHTPLS